MPATQKKPARRLRAAPITADDIAEEFRALSARRAAGMITPHEFYEARSRLLWSPRSKRRAS